MTSIMPENRHMKISTGKSLEDLAHWSASHPFTQQVDILISTSEVGAADSASGANGGGGNDIEEMLAGITSGWFSGGAKLSQIVKLAEDCVNHEPQRPFIALSAQSQDDDVWCIDTRGILTFCVCKDTYESLGLVGTKLPFKGCPERYVINLLLKKHAESVTNIQKRNAAVEAWDSRRGRVWDVLLYTDDMTLPDVLSGLSRQSAKASIKRTENIHIPTVQLSHRPTASRPPNPTDNIDDETEDWNEDAASLFEWVGMAMLGSQRLQVNDNVDPYVAVYEPPASFIGGVTYISWRGFFPPQLVQKILDVIVTRPKPPARSPSFLSMTAHSVTISPVTFLPRVSRCSASTSLSTQDKTVREPPLRMPRADGEDTWCVIIAPGPDNNSRVIGDRCVAMDNVLVGTDERKKSQCSWMMVESIGKWDARWG